MDTAYIGKEQNGCSVCKKFHISYIIGKHIREPVSVKVNIKLDVYRIVNKCSVCEKSHLYHVHLNRHQRTGPIDSIINLDVQHIGYKKVNRCSVRKITLILLPPKCAPENPD